MSVKGGMLALILTNVVCYDMEQCRKLIYLWISLKIIVTLLSSTFSPWNIHETLSLLQGDSEQMRILQKKNGLVLTISKE